MSSLGRRCGRPREWRRAMTDCKSCNGAGTWVACEHGANCDCTGYEEKCEDCAGTGQAPFRCGECFETVIPRGGVVCAPCIAANLPYVPTELESGIDRLVAASERLDEGSALVALIGEDEVAS